MLPERRVKINLHGRLKHLYPEPLELTGSTVAEILNGINKQIVALRPALGEGPNFVTVLGYHTPAELHAPINDNLEELDIMPAMGGGKGGFLQILVGVALIAVSFALPVGWAALGGMITSSTVFSFGVSLALGGLIQMLSPAPKIDQTGNSVSDPEASKYLGADQNTVKIGTRIPLAYGRVLLYGQYISFNVDAKDVAL